MSSIQDNKKYYHDFYFSGSCPKKFLKGVSILTVVFPIFIGLAYLNACRKERNYKNMCDKVGNNATQVFKAAILIPHLLQCLKEDEPENFQKAFNCLNPGDQHLFFQKVGEKPLLFDRALRYLPRDVASLSFKSGIDGYGWTQDSARKIENTKKFLKLIATDSSFNQLTSVEVNLRGIAYWTKKSDDLTNMTRNEINASHNLNQEYRVDTGFGFAKRTNHEDELYKMVAYIKDIAQKKPSTEFLIGVLGDCSSIVGGTLRNPTFVAGSMGACAADQIYLEKGEWDKVDVSFLVAGGAV